MSVSLIFLTIMNILHSWQSFFEHFHVFLVTLFEIPLRTGSKVRQINDLAWPRGSIPSSSFSA